MAFKIIFCFMIGFLPAITMATEYWVGGEKGWTLDVDYQAWAKDKVFHVGDTLVFKYPQGNHNVFKVNQTSFQQCIVPSSGGLNSGHDVITFATPGKHWYICGFPTHCSEYSQKLAIFVEGATTAPAPVAPAPTPAMEYWVGGEKGWTIDVDYQAWVKGKTFKVGDKLVFKYNKEHHNVFKVNQTSFQQCIVPPSGGLTSGHDVITLSTPGKHWYICGFPTHCSDHSQKLVINVEGGAPAPVPAAPAPSQPMEYWVGGETGWTIDVDYQAWVKGKTFKVGDKLVFKYTKGHHNVFKVNQTSFKDCIVPSSGGLTSGHDVITLSTPGKHWYICGVQTHCSDHKQKLVITVEGKALPPASPIPSPGTHVPAPAPSTKDDSNNSDRVTISAYKIFVGGVVLVWTILTLV